MTTVSDGIVTDENSICRLSTRNTFFIRDDLLGALRAACRFTLNIEPKTYNANPPTKNVVISRQTGCHAK